MKHYNITCVVLHASVTTAFNCTEGEVRTLQDHHEPIPVIGGLFALPQPVKCSGKLVSITASGFCVSDNENLTDTTDIQYRMTLWLGRLNNATDTYENMQIMQVDGNCSSTSNASNHTLGTLRSDYIGKDIFRDDMVGVSIDQNCPFVPVIRESGSVVKYYSKMDFNNLTNRSGAFLNLKASIHIRKSAHIH